MIEKNLILAKQRACKAKGLNFYVTKSGIKRDYDLFGGGYIYKIYFKDQVHVEDSEGKDIPQPENKAKKATVSSKLRNSTNEKISKNDESEQS